MRELTSGRDEVVDADIVPAGELPSSVVAAYEAVRESGDSVATATNRWLAGKKPTTRDAYTRDLRSWFEFLEAAGVDVLGARKRDADAWAVVLDRHHGLSATSRARRMSAVSAWYKYLIACDLAERNPLAAAERPKVDKDYSATEWLSEAEALALLDALEARASATRLRDVAMLRLMLNLGVRVTEVLALQISAFGSRGEQRTVLITGKGGKRVHRALPANVQESIDAYLAQRRKLEGRKRLAGHVFVTLLGNPIDRGNFAKALAGWCDLAGVRRITPHGVRHTFATLVTEHGADVDDLQEAMGHADPRTTRRYQRAGRRLENDPSHLAAEVFGQSRSGD